MALPLQPWGGVNVPPNTWAPAAGRAIRNSNVGSHQGQKNVFGETDHSIVSAFMAREVNCLFPVSTIVNFLLG